MIPKLLRINLAPMKYAAITIICVSVMIMTACKSDGTRSTTSGQQTAQSQELMKTDKVFPISIQKGGTFKSLEQIRVRAMAEISDRVQNEPEAMSIITSSYWHPEAVVNGREMRSNGYYEGYWIKFEDDFTYRYGVNDGLLGSGQYHFRLEDETLHMLDADFEQEPKVWSAKANGRAIALAGIHEYKVNNGMQIKLIPLDNPPIK